MAGVQNFDPKQHVEKTKQEWLRKQEVFKREFLRKSKYPPIAIEPFPLERQRLPFKMNAEERVLRQQWLRDQILSPNEPRHVPELRPRNFFRRMAGAPWEAATRLIAPLLTPNGARYFRYLGPKVGMYLVGVFATANYFKNNHASWEKVQGWNWFYSKAAVFPGEDPAYVPFGDYHEKHNGEFNDRGFMSRAAPITSSQDS